MMQRAKYVALALATTGALSGCGGGGGGSSPSVFEEFFGSLKNPVGLCRKEGSDWAGGRYYSNFVGILTFTATSFESKRIYYGDDKCTVKAGATVLSTSLQWAQANVAGRTNVAKLLLTSPTFTASKDGDGTGITMDSVTTKSGSEKYLMDVVDGKLCLGSDPKTADSDGYPTVIDSTYCLSR
jgi:hypothetical protein